MLGFSRGNRDLTILWLMILILTGCGSSSSSDDGQAGVVETGPAIVDQALVNTEDGPCQGGRLVIGRLDETQDDWDQGIQTATEGARQWQSDARLIEGRLACGFLSAGAVVKSTFYSDTARSLYFSYTGETRPVDPGVPAPPQLFSESMIFTDLKATLLDAGFAATAEVHPSSGINVRYNGTTTPFGPASAPEETIIIHTILVEDGMVQDVFVDAGRWQIVSDGA